MTVWIARGFLMLDVRDVDESFKVWLSNLLVNGGSRGTIAVERENFSATSWQLSANGNLPAAMYAVDMPLTRSLYGEVITRWGTLTFDQYYAMRANDAVSISGTRYRMDGLFATNIPGLTVRGQILGPTEILAEINAVRTRQAKSTMQLINIGD